MLGTRTHRQHKQRHSVPAPTRFPAPPTTFNDEQQAEWAAIGERVDNGTVTHDDATAISQLTQGIPAGAFEEADRHLVWQKIRHCLVAKAA